MLKMERMFSMDTAAELRWIEKTARDFGGVVVEYGPWLGRSTLALIHGLSGGGELHVYDNFIWEEYMDRPYARRKIEPKYKPGDSFLAEFESNLDLPRPNVNVHAGDISDMIWENCDIDFLLIDAYKNVAVIQDNLPEVFPHIKLGGIVADQDFFYETHWFIRVVMPRLREFFEPYERIETGTLMSFKKIKEVSRVQCQAAVELPRILL